MAFNLTIWEILGFLLFLVVVLILTADSLKGKTGSKFNGKNISRFGEITRADSSGSTNELKYLDASIKNSPDITINYTTPAYFLGSTANSSLTVATAGFYKWPLVYFIEAGSITLTDLLSTPYLKPVATDRLMGDSNLIDLSKLFGSTATVNNPVTLDGSADSTDINKVVKLLIPGLKAVVKDPLTIDNYYYIGLGIMSTVPYISQNQTPDNYFEGVITGRYGNFVYKKVQFTNDNLIEVDPSGVLSYDTLNFGQLTI